MDQVSIDWLIFLVVWYCVRAASEGPSTLVLSGPGPPEESIVIVSFKRHKYLITLHGSNFLSEVEKGEKEVEESYWQTHVKMKV